MSASTEQENLPPTAPSARRRPPVMVLVCVALLIIALVGGSLFWLLRGALNRSTGLAKGTPTITATDTPIWSPTAVTPPPQSMFYDTFMNNGHGWSLTSDSTDFRLLVDNMLILANANPNTTLVESVPTNTNLGDYLVSMDFTINQGGRGDSTGLYLRGDSNLDHDYRVDINGDNTVDIAKEWLDTNQNPQATMLFAPQATHYLKPLGMQNTLTVIMIDQTITLLINNQALTTLSDVSYGNGQIALFVRHGTSTRGSIASFSRVEIDHLGSPFATPTPTPTVT
jgi:hypothetical protein